MRETRDEEERTRPPKGRARTAVQKYSVMRVRGEKMEVWEGRVCWRRRPPRWRRPDSASATAEGGVEDGGDLRRWREGPMFREGEGGTQRSGARGALAREDCRRTVGAGGVFGRGGSVRAGRLGTIYVRWECAVCDGESNVRARVRVGGRQRVCG